MSNRLNINSAFTVSGEKTMRIHHYVFFSIRVAINLLLLFFLIWLLQCDISSQIWFMWMLI